MISSRHTRSNNDGDLVLEDSVDDGQTVLGDGHAHAHTHKQPVPQHTFNFASLGSVGQKSRGHNAPGYTYSHDRGYSRKPISSQHCQKEPPEVKRPPPNRPLQLDDSSTNHSSPKLTTDIRTNPSPPLSFGNTVPLVAAERRKSALEQIKNGKDQRKPVAVRASQASPTDSQRSPINADSEKPKRKTLNDILSADVNDALKRKEEIQEDLQCRGGDQNGATSSPSYHRDKNSNLPDNQPHVDDLEEELDDLDIGGRAPLRQTSFVVDSQPLDVNTAIELKQLILGSPQQVFSDEWRYQSFTFCDLPRLQYAIVQKKGGPCGVLAAVQACLLQELLFTGPRAPTPNDLCPSRKRRSEALAAALTTILWRIGDGQQASITLPGMRAHFHNSTKIRTDNLIETLSVNTLSDRDQCYSFILQNIGQFELDGSSGVILLLYSAILTRAVSGVRCDMDETDSKLMGAHGYCTQEMVNLLLTGRAVSNVFNDVMELDGGGTLRGVGARAAIGFLSLFEHYKSCRVGTYYKTPRHTIWVVCSESHFSVLFSLKMALLRDWRAERRFDLYYYDGLGRQDEEIRLTVDTSNRFYEAPSDDDLVSPLELCIRTKWPDAEIDWNGTEPLL